MTRHNQIPKGTSSPADPDAPSLLTSVPPEVRNVIYEVLFARDEVLVHNTQAYHAEEPDRSEIMDIHSLNDAVNDFHRVYETEIGADTEFHDGLSSCLSFFSTCRQLYHESIGILYGCNTFLISRALNRHDIDPDPFHDREDYSQLDFAPCWLSGLGSQAALLRRVRIDVDAVCPSHCEHQTQHFDILPLLKFLWYDVHANCSLTFARTGRKLTEHESDSSPIDDSEDDRVDCFNNILFALAVKDVLCIKQYAKSSRVLQSVYVTPRGGTGSISYHRSHDEDLQFESIEIMDEGRTIRRKSATSRSLTCLSRSLLQRIMRLAAASQPGDIAVDLDRRTIQGLPLNILQVNQRLRHSSIGPSAISASKSVIIKMATESVVEDFSHIDVLKQMVSPSYGGNGAYVAMIEEIMRQCCCHSTVRIMLEFIPKSPAILDEIRIDIKDIVRTLVFIRWGGGISIHIALRRENTTDTHSTTTIALYELQQRVFLLLSDVILEWPRDLNKNVSKELPSIWMNGRGAILEATYPATHGRDAFCVPNRHSRLNDREVDTRGYRMIANVAGTTMLRTPSGHSLIQVWESLRSRYWYDHTVRGPRYDSD